MRKILGLLIGLILVLVAVGVVSAAQGNKGGKAVTPPFPQPAEKDLQKVVFIRYAPGKEPKGARPKPTPTPSTACYDFLSGSKPKWNWVEDYYSSTNDLERVSLWATRKWDAATSATIFGDGLSGSYPWGKYDLINSISYGNYSDPNVIAVTAIWFKGKSIYEYDIMFDTDYFPGTTDLDTVALHEFGHGAGLDDLYNSVCQDEVMYGYYIGVKTTLDQGDITGIKTLYP